MIMTVARWIGDAPGATLALPAFTPWSIACLTLAVLSAVFWRSWPMKLTALPLLAVGLLGAASGARFDLAVAPNGDVAALRDADGLLTILGKRSDSFASEQWLRADADLRTAAETEKAGHCDALGCVGVLRNGATAALVLDPSVFHEDCARAQVVISPSMRHGPARPTSCSTAASWPRPAPRPSPSGLGASPGAQRAPGEDRPWSRAPRPRTVAFAPTKAGVGEAVDAPED